MAAGRIRGRLADSMCCAVVAVYLETGSRRGELTVSIWSSSPQLPRTLSMIALAKPGEASGLPLRLSGLRPTAPWIRGGVRPMPDSNTPRWLEYATPAPAPGDAVMLDVVDELCLLQLPSRSPSFKDPREPLSSSIRMNPDLWQRGTFANKAFWPGCRSRTQCIPLISQQRIRGVEYVVPG